MIDLMYRGGDLLSRAPMDIASGWAVIAFDCAGVEMLERRRDLAVLWDIRVDMAFRGYGIGASLFQAAEQWAAKRRCRQLKVETQNTNIAACRFYVRQGCTLGAVNRLAYPNLPNEIQMLWYKELVSLDD
jgi:streptothricin acetyltransferase